ncbi:hypothetical protein [Paludisphaera soli]|nr:hypothetical protein [Paludisphaera soli]
MSVRARKPDSDAWAEVSLVVGASAASTRKALAALVARARKA